MKTNFLITTILNKNIFVHLMFLFIFFLIQIQACREDQQRPNIVLIVSDDHGTDALGCYGNPLIKTPALDALAEDGVRFTNAFCTSSSCSSSRSVILTGLHNHKNGMYGLEHTYHHFRSFSNIESLPVILNKNNYRTARIGKFHVAPEIVYRFEKVFSPGKANDPASLGRSPVEMSEICKEFINRRSKKPFFLYYATDDPHRSNVYLPNGQISFNTFPKPNLFGNKEDGYPGVQEVTYKKDEVIVPYFLHDTKECREELAQYYQSVSRLDQGIERLIRILKNADKYENTLIIYISDNGVAFPAAKTTLYEPGIRLPCIVKTPYQQETGKVNKGFISWVDIMPTILDYAQVSFNKANYHGRSFKDLIDSEDTTGWDEVYGSHSFHQVTMYYPMRMVRGEKYKLIYNIAHQLPFPFATDLWQSPTWISTNNSPYYGKKKKIEFIYRPEFELYDLEEDPFELKNLSDNPDYSKILEQYKNKIKEFQKRTDDPWMHKWEFD